MTKKTNWVEKRQLLRTESEKLIASIITAEKPTKPTEILLHELAVHKIELEMQVEELRTTQNAMEEARDRYADFYEFSAVGYLTIGREGLITESNLTSAAMLGVARGELVNRRFSPFVSNSDMDRWHRLFMAVMEKADIGRRSVVLDMKRADGATFPVFIDCRRLDVKETPPELRLTLIDIGKIRRTEAEVQTAANDTDRAGN